MKDRMMVIGIVMIGTRADGICQKKDHDDQAHNDKLFKQRALERINGSLDQIAAIIGRHDLNARWKGRF